MGNKVPWKIGADVSPWYGNLVWSSFLTARSWVWSSLLTAENRSGLKYLLTAPP